MTPAEIRAEGFEPSTALALPIHVKGRHVEFLFAGGGIVSRTKWSAHPYDCVGLIGWRYADPADAQRVIAAKDAEVEQQRGLATVYRRAQLTAEEKLCRAEADAKGQRKRVSLLDGKVAAKDAEIARLDSTVRAQAASAADAYKYYATETAKLREGLVNLIDKLDGCKRFERGSGGMTIDAQIWRTVLIDVRAAWVEEARALLENTK